MKVLFDHCIPHPFSDHLTEELEVYTALYLGWDNYSDQDLIEAAEAEGFGALLTIDTDFLAFSTPGEVGIVVVNIHPSTLPYLEACSGRINEHLFKAAEDHVTYELTEETASAV